jgi:predicted nuclease of predicted toxin-antitoxin system
VGLASAHDRAIIEWSDREGRAIVTLDADFHAILAISGRNQPSVVRIRIEGLDAGATADLIVAVLAQAKAELASGAVVTVSEDRFRIRRLPLPGVRGR